MNGPCSIAMFDYRRVWNIDGQTQYLFGKIMKNLTGFWGFAEFADKPKWMFCETMATNGGTPNHPGYWLFNAISHRETNGSETLAGLKRGWNCA